MMGQGDKKIRIRRTNEQLDKEVISEFEKLVGEFGFGNVNLSALMKAADLEANVFYRRYGSMDNLYDRLAKQYDFWINNTIDISTLNTLGPKKFFAETFKTLFRNLSENSVMQKLLLYEMTTISTGIPIGKIESGEKEKLLNMEDILRRRVVGQDNALKVLTDAIVESRSGMNKPGQPIGSFFLLGPTGTGKTELAKALAEALFNDEKAMIRFDMSEFKEEHSAALLLGAPPGYVGYEEGGVLVNRIRRQPYAVVLFDEIEKAHSSVYDIFLQIMDEGKLHDRLGKEGDFSNSIVLFTSNVGSEWLSKQINEGKNPSTTDLMEVMGSYFRPEFLARLSEIVPFSPINETMLVRIFEIQLKGVIALLEKQHIDIEITEKAKNLLATRGFTPKYGARQVAGTIRNYIRRPISKMIVAGTLTAENTVVVDVADNGEIDWNVK